MTQYQDPFAQPYMDPAMQPKKTSGLAITALVLSLLGIIPCCGILFAPIGALLGLIGAAVLGLCAKKKGRGMSIAAFIIGLIFSAGQVGLCKWGYDTMWVPVKEGPGPALSAAKAGDIAGFKAEFYGAGATASDAEAKKFIDTFTQRYGPFVAAKFDETSSQQPQFGQPKATFPYVIEFENKTLSGDAEMVFSDPQKGGIIMKLGFVTIRDPEQGDLTFPGHLWQFHRRRFDMEDRPPAADHHADSPAPPARISVWAMAALLCSMVAVCPPLTLLGPLLALCALVQIKARPDVFRGTKYAVWAIVLGVVFSFGWFLAGVWWNANIRQPLLRGPVEELQAGLSGDLARFTSGFHGTAANTDADAQQFLDEIKRRYGDVLLQLTQSDDKSLGQLPQHGPARIPYVLRFNRREMPAEAEFIITESGRPPMILKWGWIRIIDPQEGDLVYPVSAADRAKPPAATSPA